MINLITFFINVILFITILKITIHLLQLLDSAHKCEMMPYVCGNLGYVINISGRKKGIGKSTTAAAIINYLIQYLQIKMFRDLDNIRKSLPEVNFVILETAFLESFQKTNSVSESIGNVLSHYHFKTFYTDNLHIRLKRDMLKDYLKRFYILNIRRKYVYSKTYFYDVVGGENALQLDPSSLELRSVEVKNNYQGRLASIYFDDEKSTDSGNVHSNNKSVKLSGKKDFRGLIRNAYEGLAFEITTKQIDKDEVKLERDQIDANLNIRNRKEINHSFLLTKILKIIYNIMIFPKKVIYFFHFKNGRMLMDYYKKSNNFLRKFESFVYDLENIIASKGYIIVYARNYYNADDVGKQDKELYEKVKLIFPKTYSYASVDTHEWKALATHYEQFSNLAIQEETSCLDNTTKVEIWKKSMDRGVDK